MARKPRLDVPCGFYHVLARGNRRATIFHDDTDYRAYLERLERYRHRDGVTLHAYVLMPNHVHLLLETGDRPLARTMQTLQLKPDIDYSNGLPQMTRESTNWPTSSARLLINSS